jgi:hypothetical protein
MANLSSLMNIDVAGVTLPVSESLAACQWLGSHLLEFGIEFKRVHNVTEGIFELSISNHQREKLQTISSKDSFEGQLVPCLWLRDGNGKMTTKESAIEALKPEERLNVVKEGYKWTVQVILHHDPPSTKSTKPIERQVFCHIWLFQPITL